MVASRSGIISHITRLQALFAFFSKFLARIQHSLYETLLDLLTYDFFLLLMIMMCIFRLLEFDFIFVLAMRWALDRISPVLVVTAL